MALDSGLPVSHTTLSGHDIYGPSYLHYKYCEQQTLIKVLHCCWLLAARAAVMWKCNSMWETGKD